ncbi:hypothetical protein KC19_2G244600 [Ceratodon purpureus]|uniref:Uncharacterized protein n=1 Tax=Ceratodon purpureus TaxID=3225 RepID=A0A8T0IZZ7_CERPU|nr:hypothetical protein KC19_2G244600 [Ceratodon purpureus]
MSSNFTFMEIANLAASVKMLCRCRNAHSPCLAAVALLKRFSIVILSLGVAATTTVAMLFDEELKPAFSSGRLAPRMSRLYNSALNQPRP